MPRLVELPISSTMAVSCCSSVKLVAASELDRARVVLAGAMSVMPPNECVGIILSVQGGRVLTSEGVLAGSSIGLLAMLAEAES